MNYLLVVQVFVRTPKSTHQGFFDRRTLVLPDVLLPADLGAEQALKPVFDLVWQSAGMERSANYNAAGN